MSTRKRKYVGFTLLDAMLGIVVLSIVVLAGSSFRYHSAQGLQKAEFQVSASRIAGLLCESWRGVGGDPSFQADVLLGPSLTISEGDGYSEGDPGWPVGFVLLEQYEIMIDSSPYYATLAYKDIQPGLRALTVMVAWAQRGARAGTIDGGVLQAVAFDETDKLYRLTSYVNTE
jgi:hypothetical protein